MTAMISDFSSRAHGKGRRPARSARSGDLAGFTGEVRELFAGPQPAQADRSADAVLTPLLDVLRAHQVWVMTAFLLGTVARDSFGDPYAAGRALQHALDLAEPEQMLFPFLISPAPEPGDGHGESLTHGETRVLHYLPTNLSAREIAGELYLSVNTVKTHQRHLYQKLGARSRTQAVERARGLGLIGPSTLRH